MVKLLAGLALLLPGLFWWVWCGDREKDPGEALAGILGVNVALIALITLFFYTIRVSITPPIFGLLLVLFFAGTVVGIIRQHGAGINWRWLVAIAAFGLLCLWRLAQAKTLVLPAWVDSLHHTLIIRKMLEAGGLTSTLEPYLPGPFYYHYAVHAVSAAFAALTGLHAAESLLILGQIISAGISLSIYALVKPLVKNWRWAALAGLLAVFATKMPGYYLTWGRYTLLMGMFMLPLAMSEALRVVQGRQRRPAAIALTLLTAGTLLSHYFAAFLLAPFLIILAVIWLVRSLIAKQFHWKELAALALPALGGLVLDSRWYWRVFRYSLGVFHPAVTLSAEAAGDVNQWHYYWTLVGPYSGYVVLALALIGALAGLFHAKTRGLALWGLLVAFLALPLGLQIAPFRNDHYALVLFLPACCLAALGLEWASGLFRRLWQPAALSACITALVAFTLIFGAQQTWNAVNPDTILADQADLAALEWIDTHTPPDTRFFINTTLWGYELYRGIHGGAWIMPYTGRWSLAPTIFYPFGGDKAFKAQMSAWGEKAANLKACDEEFWELVQEADLQYLYLREGKGSLQEVALQGCAGLKRLYTAGGVSIWMVE